MPGSRLLSYGLGRIGGHANPSVIYASFLQDGAAGTVSPKVADTLLKEGIRRVVCGHQPHGDMPLVLQQGGLQIFTADTSYACNTEWLSTDAGAVTLTPSTPNLAATPGPNTTPNPNPNPAHAEPTWAGVPFAHTSKLLALSPGHGPPEEANTRGPAVSEILLQIAVSGPGAGAGTVGGTAAVAGAKASPSPFLSPTPAWWSLKGSRTAPSRLFTHGRISNGWQHCFEVPVQPVQPIEGGLEGGLVGGLEGGLGVERYVGRMALGGWIVKGYNVFPPNPNPSPSPSPIPTPRYCLLSKGEGYRFKNKLG